MPKTSTTKKNGTEVFSRVLMDGTIIETVYRPEEKVGFIVKPRNEPAQSAESYTTAAGALLLPPSKVSPFEKGTIKVASDIEDHRSSEALLDEITQYLRAYIDLPAFEISLIAHFVLMTWVWDAWTAFPYLRFKGEPATGKTRCLEVLHQLSYRSTDLGGSTSPSSLFRMVDRVRGTAILDEGDFAKQDDMYSQLIKMLNVGYRKDGTITRSAPQGDAWEAETFSVGCPKVIANRYEFRDRALETRCLTIGMQSKRMAPHIPVELPPDFSSQGQSLRNKLLSWRLANRHSLNRDESALDALDGRVRQLALPLHNISPSTAFKRELLKALRDRSRELQEQDPSQVTLQAILDVQKDRKMDILTLQRIRERALAIAATRELPDWDYTSRRVAELVRGLCFKTRRWGTGFRVWVDDHTLAEQCERFNLIYASPDIGVECALKDLDTEN